MKKNSAFPGSLIWHFEEFPLYTKPQNSFFSRPKKETCIYTSGLQSYNTRPAFWRKRILPNKQQAISLEYVLLES